MRVVWQKGQTSYEATGYMPVASVKHVGGVKLTVLCRSSGHDRDFRLP